LSGVHFDNLIAKTGSVFILTFLFSMQIAASSKQRPCEFISPEIGLAIDRVEIGLG